MKRILGIASIVLCSMTVFSQEPKPKSPPTISVDLREKFFKAQSEARLAEGTLQQATVVAQTKNAALQEQVNKLNTACGTEHTPNLDKDGELVCVDKPKTPEPQKK